MGKNTDTKARPILEKRLIAYSAAAGAALASAPLANAQINVTTLTPPDTVFQGLTYDISFDGNEQPEFRVIQVNSAVANAQDALVRPISDGDDDGVAILMSGPPSSNYAAALSFGQPIASDTANGRIFDTSIKSQFLGYVYYGTAIYGPWPGSGEKYLGVRFKLGAGAGSTHNGWMLLEVLDNAQKIVIKQFAYNTAPDGPIAAGDVLLPVELTSFEAVADGHDVFLRWSTASETNNAGFEVQHRSLATPNSDFATVTFLEGAGSTTDARSYSVRMRELAPGNHEFRLKQVDLDGAFSYSPVVESFVEIPETHLLGSAYPNPFNPSSNFTLALSETQRVEVAVYDALGRRVALLHNGILEADRQHNFTIDGSSLPSGAYIYRVVGEGFAESKTVALIK